MSAWFTVPRPRPDARARVFCLPYAGGGTWIFQAWLDQMPHEVELALVQLPGRERRLGDAPVGSAVELAAHLDAAATLDRPFAFFGHSMGAVVAYEWARRRMESGAEAPRRVFVSASPAPHFGPERPPMHTEDDATFLRRLRALGGTPEEVLQHEELLGIMLPTLRADFQVIETYECDGSQRLACPVVSFLDPNDPVVSVEAATAWRQLTSASFDRHDVSGGHFYVTQAQFGHHLSHQLERWLHDL